MPSRQCLSRSRPAALSSPGLPAVVIAEAWVGKAKLHTRPSARESDGRNLTLTQASDPARVVTRAERRAGTRTKAASLRMQAHGCFRKWLGLPISLSEPLPGLPGPTANLTNVLRNRTSGVGRTLQNTIHDNKAFYQFVECLRDLDIGCRSCIVNYNTM